MRRGREEQLWEVEHCPAPVWCERAAYRLFAEQLPVLESDEGLEWAAMAVAMHAFDDLRPADVLCRFDALAARIRRRVRTSRVDVVLAHLHDVLFEEERFHGAEYDPRLPLYRYLPAVLELKRGSSPVLCLVYKAVARRVGLRVVGLNLVQRFMIAVVANNTTQVIDVCAGGRLVAADELKALLSASASVLPRRLALSADDLPCCSHRQWLSRMLADLQHVYAAGGHADDLAAMTELQDLVYLADL